MKRTHLRLNYFWEEEALAAMRHCEGWRGVNSAGYGVQSKSQGNAVETRFQQPGLGVCDPLISSSFSFIH